MQLPNVLIPFSACLALVASVAQSVAAQAVTPAAAHTTLARDDASTRDAARLAGPATVFDTSTNAFGFPSPLLDAKQRRAFAVGNALFRANWVTAPSSAEGLDGLGPFFNARSCSSCHAKDGRSQPPAEGELDRHGLLVRIGVRVANAADAPHPAYGAQVQDQAIAGTAPEAQVGLSWQKTVGAYGDGEPFELIAPHYELRQLAFGPLGDDVVLGGRTGPQLIGLGLLEAIPDAALLALADPDDRDRDGISGRVHLVPDGDGTRIGRFGWKATQPTVLAQTAGAFANDMGITTSLHAHEPLTAIERAQVTFASGGAPELDDHKLDRIVFYTRTIAVPAQRDPDAPAVRAGREHFEAFGCAKCHVESFETGPVDFHDRFAGITIRPYTDLLLHDLGPELADEKRDGDARPSEWRTPPLWGIGLIPVVNGHERYLHDGRARGLAEAILWHGGEAEAAREAFRRAPKAEREQLLAFLRSL